MKNINFHISEHTIIEPFGSKYVLFYNVLLRKGIIADHKSLNILSHFLNNTLNDLEINTISFKDVSTFSLSKCLLDNPAGIYQNIPNRLPKASVNEFIKLLIKNDILVANNNYIKKLAKKESILDSYHTGNFHQQIGNFILYNKKKQTPDKWWVLQKFNKTLKCVKNTPYLWVQEKFIKAFFSDLIRGKSILDFGCGIGYYSNFFHSQNAYVIGFDTNLEYIKIAKTVFHENKKLKFIHCNITKVGDLDILRDEKFDFIYLADVFLYYFEPYEKLNIKPYQLLRKLRSFLKNNGSIFILDPHGCFHLQSWHAKHMPYIICTEYKNRKFRVTPTLMELSFAVEKSGLYINKIRELFYEGQNSSSQNKNICKEFPLWWFFELKAK